MKTGTQGSWRSLMPLSKSLHKLADTILHEKVKKEKNKAHRGPAHSLTDDQILEFRALHIYHGWSVANLARRFGLQYPTAYNYSIFYTAPFIKPLGPLANPPVNPGRKPRGK